MSFGLEVKHAANNSTILTDDRFYYAYIGKFQMAYVPYETTKTLPVKTINCTVTVACPGFPVVFFKPPQIFTSSPTANSAAQGAVIKYIRNNGNGTYTIDGVYNNYAGGSPPEIRVFAKYQDRGAQGDYGLRLYTASGGLAYDSNTKPLRTPDIFSGVVRYPAFWDNSVQDLAWFGAGDAEKTFDVGGAVPLEHASICVTSRSHCVTTYGIWMIPGGLRNIYFSFWEGLWAFRKTNNAGASINWLYSHWQKVRPHPTHPTYNTYDNVAYGSSLYSVSSSLMMIDNRNYP